MIQEISPKQYHVEYRTDRTPAEQSFLILGSGKGILVKECGEAFHLPHFSDFTAAGVPLETLGASSRYLFAIDDDWFFLVPRECIPDELLSTGYHFESPFGFRDHEPRWEGFAGETASQFWRFYDTRKFCGRCGQPMVHSDTERAMVCRNCGRIEYPKINPAIIVAVTDGDRILLTRYATNANHYRKKALIAGYVEVGEDPVDTVRREVFEETGLHVKNIKPYKIQPWSFTDAMMIAYTAELDGSDRITLQRSELCEAAFYDRKDVPYNPSTASIGNELQQAFRRGEF